MFFLFNVTLFSLIMAFNAHAQGPSEEIVLSNQVQQLLKVNDEMLNTDEVVQLAKKILSNRQHYSNDTLAKIFLLSAQVASNQGDINTVFKFAELGLAANSLDQKVNLSLLLEIAEVYVVQKQYQKLLELMQDVVINNEFSGNTKHQLLALSYRSVAFAMLGQHQKSLNDLQQVEIGISQSDLSEHIELLTILAWVYHNLDDYQTSLTMQLKILKLRFEMRQMHNVEQTYLYLGWAYFYLQRFDDAYNAFWESKKYALNKKAPIRAAHADKGLGLVLLKQQQFSDAIVPLEQAVKAYHQHKMPTARIESLTALAKAKIEINQVSEGYSLLVEIIQLLDGEDISLKFAGFYGMVAKMHFAQKNYQEAYHWRAKFSQVLLTKLDYMKKSSSLVYEFSHLTTGLEPKVQPIDASKQLAVKLAQNSELSSNFIGKYQRQRVIIISLTALVCLLLITLLGSMLRLRARKRHLAYEATEKPSHIIASPMQIKFDYQLTFKKSRKFQYSLSVGYLVIENWQELIFHFNDKRICEVTKDIGSVINEQLTEFDYAGLLNEGEYLLLFEHQDIEEVRGKLDKLVQAINTRAFANLGGFSVVMKYSLHSPDFTDIDPYLFLARIAESVNIAPINQSSANQPSVNQAKVS